LGTSFGCGGRQCTCGTTMQWIWLVVVCVSDHCIYHRIHAAYFFQLLEPSFTLPKQSSCRGNSRTRCFDGIMTMLKLVKTLQKKAMRLQICAAVRTQILMNGPSVPRPQSLPDRSARSMINSPYGKVKHWLHIRIPKPPDESNMSNIQRKNSRSLGTASLSTLVVITNGYA